MVQVPIGVAIATLIDNIAKATERKTARAAIASEAATALIRRADATGAKRPPNHPLDPGERLIVESPRACANHPRPRPSFTSRGQHWGEPREEKRFPHLPFRTCHVEAGSGIDAGRADQALAIPTAALPEEAALPSMVIKPGCCSIRRNQARTEGNVVRSKSHWSARWV